MTRTCGIGVLAVVLAAGVVELGRAQQETVERVTVAFSDPARPGTLAVQLLHGSLTVRAADRRDVLIEARPRGQERGDANASGLRRLPQRGSFSVEEENNTMRLSSPMPNGRTDFTILVPARTNLKVALVNDGTLTIEGIDGDIEATNLNGPITLTRVAGSVVAHSTNGRVVATVSRVAAQKAMAFTSLNGAVDVTLPASVKANVKLRSDQGDIYTDFDVQLTPSKEPVVKDARQGGGRYRIDVDRTLYGTINGGGPEFELRTFNGPVYLRKGT
jgi:hypothetical protein